MKSLLLAAAIALMLSLLATPLYIKFLVKWEWGQFVREDGPTTHITKRGTPTMGGVVIIASTVIGYALSHVVPGTKPMAVGTLLIIGLMIGLGFVGFLDDYLKIRRANSDGLAEWQKLLGQGIVGVSFAIASITLTNENGVHPASTHISWVRDTPLDLMILGPVFGVLAYVVWANLIVAGMSNGVNFSDGLDGLCAGVSSMVAGAFILITIWQNNQACSPNLVMEKCYTAPNPYDLAIFSAALAGSCFGFLWWNASVAQIFMGDTGSLALGGAFAGLAIVTRTEFLIVLLGGVFVMEAASVLIQRTVFKSSRLAMQKGWLKLEKPIRVFRMAPLHHHFEQLGWREITVVVRLWIIAGLLAALGLSVFYGEWVVGGVV